MVDVELGEIRMDENDEDMGEFGSLGTAVRNERTDRLGNSGDDMEIDNGEKVRESGKHRSKDRKRSRREEKEQGSKDKERVKEREKDDTRGGERLESSRERRKEEKSEYARDREHEKDRDREKERGRERLREKDYERDKYRDKDRELERSKDRGKEHDRERARSIDWDRDRGRDRGKDRGREREKERDAERERDLVREHDRGKEREKVHDHERERHIEREKDRDRERKEKDREKGKDRDRLKDREREKEKTRDREKEKEKEEREKDKLERDKGKEKSREKEMGRSREADQDNSRVREREIARGEKHERVKYEEVHDEDRKEMPMPSSLTNDLEERSNKMKEERLKRKSDGGSEISSWVSKSRRLAEKRNAEKDKTLRLSKAFEEQDNILDESEDEDATLQSEKDLAGVKILHGLDKVMEGGSVVLTLKDQSILADGDINEEADMLENVEIGEQKQRDDAYRAAKKKTGIYDDKFSDDMGSRKTILPQYDDPVEDEGVTLDETGRFTGEAEKKLEELRRRIEGSNAKQIYEDVSSSGKTLSDYYTPDEMLQFKKPKKKKSLRKKEKLDLDALEAEAIASGLGAQDLGSRNDLKRQIAKEDQERSEAEKRSNAYQLAYAKAEEASKVLRQEQTLTVQSAEDDNLVFGEEYEDLQRSLEQARKLALKKQDETAATGPQAVALIATPNKEQADTQSPSEEEPQENKVVITEMEEFVLGLQLNEETHKPESEDVFKDEDEVPGSPEQETKAEPSGWTEVKETNKAELPPNEEKEDIAPDEIIHEVAVGKGLSGALKLLKDRGTLKESIDWGGRNMDKKKSKLVGIRDNDGPKEIHIERTDEFGRIMTPKEAFRMISHKFHGKGPGKMKQEKRMKQYHEDLKTKQMKASDTPLMAMEKMREAQARLKTPYLVLSGHVKPGQTSDPRSGFATVEKDHLGSLTPMLGDKKVEHFLGINRRPDSGSMGPPPPKKPKT